MREGWGRQEGYNEDRGREHENGTEVDWGKERETQLRGTEGENDKNALNGRREWQSEKGGRLQKSRGKEQELEETHTDTHPLTLHSLYSLSTSMITLPPLPPSLTYSFVPPIPPSISFHITPSCLSFLFHWRLISPFVFSSLLSHFPHVPISFVLLRSFSPLLFLDPQLHATNVQT